MLSLDARQSSEPSSDNANTITAVTTQDQMQIRTRLESLFIEDSNPRDKTVRIYGLLLYGVVLLTTFCFQRRFTM